MGQPHMIAPMLKLHDGIKKVEEAQKALNKEAEKTADAPPAAATTLQAPVFKETVDQESLALKQMVIDANAASEALDEMLRVDPKFQFALAADTAAVELFGNVVKQTAEDARQPLEEINEKIKELSEGAAALLMQVGRSLQSAFMNMFNGKSVIESLGEAIMNLVKQLLAAAAAAAIVALIISSITGVPFSKSFGAAFSGLTGINAAASPQGIPGANTPSPFNQPQVNISGQFRLDGQDLVLAVQRAQNTRNSFT
jgi:tetrahydromethanopterin S-methyltransferase subunit B